MVSSAGAKALTPEIPPTAPPPSRVVGMCSPLVALLPSSITDIHDYASQLTLSQNNGTPVLHANPSLHGPVCVVYASIYIQDRNPRRETICVLLVWPLQVTPISMNDHLYVSHFGERDAAGCCKYSGAHVTRSVVFYLYITPIGGPDPSGHT